MNKNIGKILLTLIIPFVSLTASEEDFLGLYVGGEAGLQCFPRVDGWGDVDHQLGAALGIYLGYNWQLAENALIGLELHDSAIMGRLGFVRSDWLFYGTGGTRLLAYHFEGSQPVSFSDFHFKLAPCFGVGVEKMLSNRWSLGFELGGCYCKNPHTWEDKFHANVIGTALFRVSYNFGCASSWSR